jgi:hypothetical protein
MNDPPGRQAEAVERDRSLARRNRLGLQDWNLVVARAN